MATTMTTMTTWNPTTHADYDVLKGRDVFSRDGEKVGSITEIWHPDVEMPAARGQHFFLLDPGKLKDWFGGFDKVYLPESAIDEVRSDRVVLSFSQDQVKRADWTTKPVGFDRYRRY